MLLGLLYVPQAPIPGFQLVEQHAIMEPGQGFRKSPPILQVALREALVLGEFSMKIFGQPIYDFGNPAGQALPFKDVTAEPVKQNEFAIDGERRFQPGVLDALFQIAEEFFAAIWKW